MSERGMAFNSRQDRWRTFHGRHGVLFTRVIFSPELMEMVEVSQQHYDDKSVASPPERFPGCYGFSTTEIKTLQLRSGVYRVILDFGHPCFFQPGDKINYITMREQPLKTRIGEIERSNPLNLYAVAGKDF